MSTNKTKKQDLISGDIDDNLQPEIVFIPDDEVISVPSYLNDKEHENYNEDSGVIGFMNRNFFMD